MLLTRRRARAGVREAVAGVRAAVADAVERGLPPLFAQVSADLLREPESAVAAWVDFELRSAEYYSLLAELSGSGPDRDAAEGFLPSGMADRVRGLRLDDARLRVSLRGYQSFGARFALVQKRVILGDEMGLGKTVQAIAALAHLAARGETHFLVVCPASVLINWSREVRARSTLRALPVHGPERREAFAEWRETGGVAVTTFDALHTLPDAADAACPPRDAGGRRGPLCEEPGDPSFARGLRLVGADGPGAVPDRDADGEPGGGVPQPGPPAPARAGARGQRRAGRRGLGGVPPCRGPRLSAPQSAGRPHRTARRGPGGRVGGVQRGRSAGVPGGRGRRALHADAPCRVRPSGDLRQAEPAARTGRGGGGQRPESGRVLVLPRGARRRARGAGRRGVRAAVGQRGGEQAPGAGRRLRRGGRPRGAAVPDPGRMGSG